MVRGTGATDQSLSEGPPGASHTHDPITGDGKTVGRGLQQLPGRLQQFDTQLFVAAIVTAPLADAGLQLCRRDGRLKVEIDAGSPYRREQIWPAQTIAARFGDWS
jgi:hypothetical protein